MVMEPSCLDGSKLLLAGLGPYHQVTANVGQTEFSNSHSPTGSPPSIKQRQDTAVTPVSEYQSIGIGTYLANYLYERLNPSVGFTYNSPPERMAHLGVFILQQVKKTIQGCDGETAVAIFYADGTFRYMPREEVHEVDSWMADLDKAVQPLWWHVANPSMKADAFKGELERRFRQI